MRCVLRFAMALSVLAAALAVPSTILADVAPAPCAASGLVAVVTPGATAPTTVGPAVATATTQGATDPAFHDDQYSVSLTAAEAGAAGCVGAAAPGGTHATATDWSVLGVLSGSALRADLVPAAGDGSGWHLRMAIKDLRVGGVPTDVVRGTSMPVGSWGTVTIGAQASLPALQPLRWWAAALELRVVHAHAGLAAGTIVFVGYAAANRPPAPPPVKPKPAPTTTAPVTTTTPGTTTTATTTTAPTTTAPTTTTRPTKTTPRKPHRKKPKRSKPSKPRGPKIGDPLTVTPPLYVDDYSFPVAGGADWGDTYGGERSDVPGGWHHGDDLFAPLGAPVVAVADGTVFSVGWNEVGGWRLWLVDHAGNYFYYAHLSGYTRLGRDNRAVRRGDVIGFVGNTGDAFTTQPHLHFEVHPNAFLYLGYDGAVDPTSYLRAWPLVKQVHVLPPVQLPDGAPSGFGSVTDFRRLLAVHPLPKKPQSVQKRPASVAPRKRPASSLAAGATRVRATDSGGGALPVVLGIVILACAFGAVAHAARDGRT